MRRSPILFHKSRRDHISVATRLANFFASVLAMHVRLILIICCYVPVVSSLLAVFGKDAELKLGVPRSVVRTEPTPLLFWMLFCILAYKKV